LKCRLTVAIDSLNVIWKIHFQRCIFGEQRAQRPQNEPKWGTVVLYQSVFKDMQVVCDIEIVDMNETDLERAIRDSIESYIEMESREGRLQGRQNATHCPRTVLNSAAGRAAEARYMLTSKRKDGIAKHSKLEAIEPSIYNNQRRNDIFKDGASKRTGTTEYRQIESIDNAFERFHINGAKHSGFGEDIETTENDMHMRALLEHMFKRPVVLYQRKRNGHCLFECFEKFGDVKTIRQSLISHYIDHPELLDFGDTVFPRTYIDDMRCLNPDGSLQQRASFDSQGDEAQITALARIYKTNIVTVAFTGPMRMQRLTFVVYLTKNIDGVQKLRSLYTDDPVEVQKSLQNGNPNSIMIGLVDGHWMTFDIMFH
jgi:hypothetical protein